ncbi:MAG: AarF/ABC1/UbiB kinase family protein [Crocinitomicaceae bacterium]|nr:AarF/ABC1/UbiB kinase family protein [Crocinitomicaceae bacterium]
MKTINSIPTSKIERAGQLVKTGLKVGTNYVAYYGEKLVNPSLTKEKLNENNATDIYDGLQNLKGSALKVAQMLSMDKNILPQAYVDKFSLSQFSVPALSAPLVRKTFKKYLNAYPEEIFDTFSADAIHAASIGQVHKATKNELTLAVKIQYPGVADSISSDLALVKPFAVRMFNMKGKDLDKYFIEVEQKLLEETNYNLEITQSISISESCKHIKNMRFPIYYPDLSSEKIITMEWMDGLHLSEYCTQETDKQKRTEVAQALWDFYMFQLHQLRSVHADPHPGNFLVDENNQLIAIDFGCIKAIPDEFYTPYFDLVDPNILNNESEYEKRLIALEIIRDEDSTSDIIEIKSFFYNLLSLFTKPFQEKTFDFADEQFFAEIARLGESFTKNDNLKKLNGNRGSKHFLYMNRTFFGLYNLLHDLKAEIITNN